jgi:putative DNA primase/helicase
MSDRLTITLGPRERNGIRAVIAELGAKQAIDKFDVLSEFHRRKFRENVVARFRLGEDAHEFVETMILDALEAAESEVTTKHSTPTLVTLANVKPKPISWHWDKTIPRGAITYIFGDAGQGKSQLATDIVSRRSRGATMPPNDFDAGEPPTNSLILTCEDDIERTVVPRLLATGADMKRIISLRDVTPWGSDTARPAQLPTDMPMIAEIIRAHAIDTVVVDVFTGFLVDGANPNCDSEMRQCMAAINAVAVETQSTWLLLGHPNKREGAKSVHRAGGSVAIVAASRAAFAVGQDPDDPTTKVFCPVKFNLGPRPHSLTFTIEPVDAVSRIVWGGSTTLTASDVLASEAKSTGGGSKLEQAKDIITDILSNGPRGSNEVLGAVEAAGIGERTYHAARKSLGVKSERIGGLGKDGQWLLTMAANGYDHETF